MDARDAPHAGLILSHAIPVDYFPACRWYYTSSNRAVSRGKGHPWTRMGKELTIPIPIWKAALWLFGLAIILFNFLLRLKRTVEASIKNCTSVDKQFRIIVSDYD
jgi:hypothetical protein